MTTVEVVHLVDDEGLAAHLAPRRDVVVEAGPTGPDDDRRFGLEEGPFEHYERRVRVRHLADGQHEVTQATTYRLGIGFWSIVFVLPMRAALRRPGGRTPWWAPPQVLDRQAAASLAALASLSIVGGYMGTLITQTLTYAADEFDVGERVQSDTFAAVRIGILLSMAVAAWADRRGRRRALLWSVVGGILATSLGALAPGMVALGVTQLVARGLSTALALLIVVVVAEEMPAGSRAYGVSLLTMTAALGAGMVLWLLPLVELDERAWRALYVVPLLFLPLVRLTAPLLHESRRFVRRHAVARFAGHGRRLGLLAGSALALAVFSSPASQLQNEYLREDWGFSAAQITAFTILTVTPGGLGIILGGRLADVRGKRVIGGIGVAGGTAFTAFMYLTGSAPALWAASAIGSVIGGLAVPALSVYGPELFPTSLRTKANVAITTLGVTGSVIGLVIAGRLAERWSLGAGVATLAVAPAVVVLLLIPRYPETAHRELEELNPEDAPSATSLGRLAP
ncbi:MAG TPA: MFS transporter [Acidimicrobiales bacterium]|nr:MFS transporter [Acidimicrobiales bacterium]